MRCSFRAFRIVCTCFAYTVKDKTISRGCQAIFYNKDKIKTAARFWQLLNENL